MEAKKNNKFIDFMRRYGAYVFAGILIVVIGVSLGVVYSHNSNQSVVDVSNDDKNKDDDKGNQTPDKEPDNKEPDDKDPGKTDEPVDADPLKFGLPMQNATIIKDFTDKKLIIMLHIFCPSSYISFSNFIIIFAIRYKLFKKIFILRRCDNEKNKF